MTASTDLQGLASLMADPRLKLDERAVLAYGLTRPTGWHFSPATYRELGIGRDRLKRIIGRLEELGCLKRDPSRLPTGRYSPARYTFALPSPADRPRQTESERD